MEKNNDQLAISVKNLHKEYVSYKKPYDILWETISGKAKHTIFQALENISFDIKKGEVVGIIGANGAGKSTLLKILAGTLNKTSGDIKINGRLSAILELGTGFHPDYTGRENIFLGGMCLGMTRSEVESKLNWIIDFSELEKFIDQPFKTYSSGMQARLTFATAISVDPEIFIVDEALAAGDSGFVEKCLGRMDEIVKTGSTVLIVTHNTNLIPRFGSRAIWIENGSIKADGDAKEIAKRYEISAYESAQRRMGRQNKLEEVIGDQKIAITGLSIYGSSVADGVYLQGKPFAIELNIESLITSSTANIIIFISRNDGQLVWSSSNYNYLNSSYEVSQKEFFFQPGTHNVKIQLDNLQLNSGSYYINAGVEPSKDMARVSDYHDWKIRLAEFSVVRSDHLIASKVFDSPSYWALTQKISVKNTTGLSENGENESVNSHKCILLDYPYPYRSAISISNDCEFLTRNAYEGLHKLLCESSGLNLEVTNSAFFYTTQSVCHSSIGYFDGLTNRRSSDAGYISEMINAGWIDTIHAYGDFDKGGFKRSMAINVLEEFSKRNLTIPIFSNHGSDQNSQNVGYCELNGYQEGDNPISPSYHLDITRQLGVKYFWVDTEITNVPTNLESVFRTVWARDDTSLLLFSRYRGLIGKPAPNAGSLAEQISIQDIDRIIKNGATCIYYQHLGVSKRNDFGGFEANQSPYFGDKEFRVLEYLALKFHEGICLVAGVGRLLKYIEVRNSIYFEKQGMHLILKSSINGIEAEDLSGLSFEIYPIGSISEISFQNSRGFLDKLIFSKKSIAELGEVLYIPWKRLV
jgi:lipopolysaccharide transport system ATP-binding protein